MQHSILATPSVLGQMENCLDLVLTKLSEDILSFDREPPRGNSYRFTLILYVSLAQTQVET